VVAALGDHATDAQIAAFRAEYGLDKPVWRQYLDFVVGALQGDLGNSLVPPQQDVLTAISSALPVSVQLAVMGLVIALVVAVPLALWSAHHEGGVIDRVISAATFGVLSVPSFLAGLLLIMVTVNWLGWFPRSQWVRIGDSLSGNLSHAILPAITISLLEMAMFTRVLRSDLVTTLREDYILASKAKGMPTLRVLFSDALRPSSFSLITMMGLALGGMIGSTVIVETLFSLPGMGTLIVRAAQQGDSPMLLGAVVVIAVIYVLVNSAIDVLYTYLDPRSRRVHV